MVVRPLRVSRLGEACAYCSGPAEAYDHVIPRRLSDFFDAGWNLLPACNKCNLAKSDHLKLDWIKTPGKDHYEDAAIWAAVYTNLDARPSDKKKVIRMAMADLGKWGAMFKMMALGAFEVYAHEHVCEFWKQCEEKCSTHGELMELTEESFVTFHVPQGLKGLIHGMAAR